MDVIGEYKVLLSCQAVSHEKLELFSGIWCENGSVEDMNVI